MKLWSSGSSSGPQQRGPHRRPVLLVNLDFRDVVYSHLWGRAMLAGCAQRNFIVDVVTVNPFAGRDLAGELGVPRSALDLQTDGKVIYLDNPDEGRARAVIDQLLQRKDPYQTVILNCEASLFGHLLIDREAQLSRPVWIAYDRHLHNDLRSLDKERLSQRVATSHLHLYFIQEIVTDAEQAFSQDGVVETFKQLGLPAHHIHLQPWPLDDEFFAPQPAAAAGDDFVIFSGGDSGRDYATLFEAIRDLPVKLRLCASNYPKPIPANVTILPRLALHQFRDEVARATVVMVPLTGHPMVSGITVIAMAKMMGKPVIASDNRVVRIHIPAQGDGGYLTQTGNPALLRILLRGLIDSPAERDRLAREGREQALRNLSLRTFANRMLELTDTLTG